MGLRLDQIRRSFGATEAVAGVTLDVADGEIVCLFGPSGCGKTTLLRAAGGFEPHEGSVHLDGETLADSKTFVPPERRPIGFVFQDYVLFPHLTAQENTAFALQALPRAERNALARRKLRALGLEGLADRYPHQLSGGQQQRVALARAFVRQPRAMLLDEPFASIDPSLRRKLREELRLLLKSSGVATVLVTHDADEALSIGDRIAIMRAGKIIECGTPHQTYFRPRTIEAACLFPAAQIFEAAAERGRLDTPFGSATFAGAGGRKTVVALRGALLGAADPAGSVVIQDCRFDPPGWIAVARAPSGATAAICLKEPIAQGERAAVTIDHGLLRVFDA